MRKLTKYVDEVAGLQIPFVKNPNHFMGVLHCFTNLKIHGLCPQKPSLLKGFVLLRMLIVAAHLFLG